MTVRRTELTCPGHSLKMMQKAAGSDADEVIFDLEDACAVSQKVAARATVIEALTTSTFTNGKVRAYRVNGVETAWCYRDLIEVLEAAGAFVDVVVVPKVQRADDLRFVDTLITQIERAHRLPPGRIRLEALIETANGVLHAEAIAHSTPRLASLIFGLFDYAGDVGARDFRDDHFTMFAWQRSQLIAAARSAGLDAIDGVTAQIKEPTVCERESRLAAKLGFDGKWAIHPMQVPIINAAFTPTPEELAHAQRLVDAYREADAQGLGAISVDNEMVDAATLKSHQKKLDIARHMSQGTVAGA